MYDVAVIASTIRARQPLLDRSVRTWVDDVRASGLSVALRIYGDGCGPKDATIAGLEQYTDLQTFAALTPSGSHVTGYNHFWRETQADVYLFTHPEVMFRPGTIATAHRLAEHDTFVAFKVFWLSPEMTDRMGDVDIAHIEENPDLYYRDPREHGDFYFNSDIRGIQRWESTTTYAIDSVTAAKLFPMPAFTEWGPDDPYLLEKRRRLQIRNRTVMDPVLLHQWHPHGEIDTERVVRIAGEAL